MDVLKARKRAQQQKEAEKEPGKKAEETAGAPTGDSEKKKKSSGKKKSGARKSPPGSAEVEKTRSAQSSKALKEKTGEKAPGPGGAAREEGGVLAEEIPDGARKSEEMELTADDLSSLLGTQDMPELPDIEMSMDIGPEPDSGKAWRKEFVAAPPEEKTKGAAEPAAAEVPAVREESQPPAETEKESEYAAGIADEAKVEEEKIGPVEAPLEFLSFMLGEEEYALPLNRISEIIKPRPITHVPRSKGFVLGVVSLRGVIIPVFDLPAKLNLGKVKWNRSSRMVIVRRSDGELVGLATDSVEDVVRVLPGDIEPPPPAMGGVEAQYLEGVGRAEESRRTRVYRESGESGKKEDKEQEKRPARKKLVILLNLDKVAAL